MGKRKQKKSGGDEPEQAWLVTFSDLVTLLLTFFVLLLSMSTMDRSIVEQSFTLFSKKLAFMQQMGSGEISPRIKLTKEILEKPAEIFEKKERIIDLLFPEEKLQPEFSKSTLKENLSILAKPEGVAILLSEGILFKPGQTELIPEANIILEQIFQLLTSTSAPVNISGHTDSTGGPQTDNFLLAAERALSVLKYYLQKGLEPDRFSVSSYGPEMPVAPNDTEKGRSKNRRVEILLKTVGYSATYM